MLNTWKANITANYFPNSTPQIKMKIKRGICFTGPKVLVEKKNKVIIDTFILTIYL